MDFDKLDPADIVTELREIADNLRNGDLFVRDIERLGDLAEELRNSEPPQKVDSLLPNFFVHY